MTTQMHASYAHTHTQSFTTLPSSDEHTKNCKIALQKKKKKKLNFALRRDAVSAPQEVCVKLTAQGLCFKKPPETCQLDCSFQCVCLWAGRRLGLASLRGAHCHTQPPNPTHPELLAVRPSKRLNQTLYAYAAFLSQCCRAFCSRHSVFVFSRLTEFIFTYTQSHSLFSAYVSNVTNHSNVVTYQISKCLKK